MSEDHNTQALRPPRGGVASFNLEETIARLKAKPEWTSEDRLAMSLVKDDHLNLLLMVLKKGARLAEHRTRGPIALQVLGGAIRFRIGSTEKHLSHGDLIALDRDIAHALEALEESAVLLTTAIG